MEIQSEKKKKKISDNLSTSTYPIPLDLILEILKASTVQTLARFLCVSKQYTSIIRNRDFMKSYLIKSSTRPQSLIFTFRGKSSGKHFFFSASQGESSSSSSSVATYLMKYHSRPYNIVAPSVHGLICYGHPSKLMVYNPSTKRSITLPKIDFERIDMYHYLGYDPIDGDYKVLCMVKGLDCLAQTLRVLTLGNGNSWRVIEDYPPHIPHSPEICINGVLYYKALLHTDMSLAVMSFDVRFEKFDLIKLPGPAVFPKLTSYEGKLVVLFSGNADCSTHLWVLEDAAKHEWSKKYYVLPRIDGVRFLNPFCVVAHAGEIVFAPEEASVNPFCVVYYHPKKNTVRRVYIERITEFKDPFWDKVSNQETISVFSGQVDNLISLFGCS